MTTYTVKPATGRSTSVSCSRSANDSDRVVNVGEWGPVYVEDVAGIHASARTIERSSDVHAAARPVEIDAVADPAHRWWRRVRVRTNIIYTIDAPISNSGSSNGLAHRRASARATSTSVCLDRTPTPVRSEVILPSRFRDDPSGSHSRSTGPGSGQRQVDDPVSIFTCIEGTDRRAGDGPVRGPGGRDIVLQAWPGLTPVAYASEAQRRHGTRRHRLRSSARRSPGEGSVTIRQAPPRSTRRLRQCTRHPRPRADGRSRRRRTRIRATTRSRTSGSAPATSSSSGCARDSPAGPQAAWPARPVRPRYQANRRWISSDWQVVRPTAPSDIDEIVLAQDAAACGLVSAMADRLDDDAWRVVLGSMLNGESKYLGSDGIGLAPTLAVDYREFLDAVDERGLVPAGYTDLDFAQDLLADYGVTPDPLLLREALGCPQALPPVPRGCGTHGSTGGRSRSHGQLVLRRRHGRPGQVV